MIAARGLYTEFFFCLVTWECFLLFSVVCGSGSDHVIRWVGECIWTGIGTSLASLALFSLRGPGLRYPGLEDTGVWIGARAGKLGPG